MPFSRPTIHRVCQQRGVVSLLAMMLMAAIIAIALTTSLLILNELRQTEVITQSLSASYAAEAGLENGLYVVKMNRPTISMESTVGAGSSDTALTVANDQPLGGSGATWKRTASSSMLNFSVPSLGPDQSVSFDLYNPDHPTYSVNDLNANGSEDCGNSDLYFLNPNPCVHSMYVTWNDTCGGFSWLEVSVTDLGPLFSGDTTTQPVIGKFSGACLAPSGYSGETNITACTPLTLQNQVVSINPSDNITPTQVPIDGRPERFTFRPLLPVDSNELAGCSIKNFTAEFHDDHWADHDSGADVFTGSQLEEYHRNHTAPIPAHITITSTGTFGKTKQAVTATLPWKAPPSGLLNFVLFSEESIVK